MALSELLEICERESVNVGWSFLLLSEERGDKTGLRGKGERMLPRLFIVARGSDPGRMA